MVKPTKNQTKWKAHIDAASAAGKTLAEYARSQGRDVRKMYAYSRAIQQRQQPVTKPKFVRVQPLAATTPGVRIDLANGLRVKIAAPTDLGSLPAQLAKLSGCESMRRYRCTCVGRRLTSGSR